MIAGVSGASSFIRATTSQPVMPGICKSMIAQSNEAFSRALTAAAPSSQIVASCPRAGSSTAMIWRISGSSSTNNTRSGLHKETLKTTLPIPFGEHYFVAWLSHRRSLSRKGRGDSTLATARQRGVPSVSPRRCLADRETALDRHGPDPSTTSASAGEQLFQRQLETGEHVAAIQRLRRSQMLAFVGGGVDVRGLCLGINDPRQAAAGREVLRQLAFNLARRVAVAEHFHRQVGVQVGYR